MKTAINDLKKYTFEFRQHWLGYLMLLLGLDLVNQFLIIPLFRYATTFILQASAIPFVSYQNIVTIITSHTFVFVILIIELLLLLLVIYAEFAFTLLSIKQISDEEFTLKNVFRQTWQRIKQIRFASLILLALYFLLVVPFADIIFRTPLLAKIQIPEFILDYMTRTPILLGCLIAFYVIVIFFGVRLLYTLPLMIFAEKKTRTAMKKSWQLTKNKQWWPLIFRLILVTLAVMIVAGIFYLLIYGMQLLWDLLPGKYAALILAILNLSLIQIGSELMFVYSTVVSLLIIFAPLKLENDQQQEKQERRYSKSLIAFTSLAALIIIASSVTTNIMYLTGVNAKAPIIVSHRGVDNKNGVQNTLAALKKTAKEKPDYVEIDLHETKDKQFVLLHDENLVELTGVNKMPSQLTLKELIKLTAKEDGHQAKIASFDAYLKEAEKLHQKLLIEIKTTPKDSKKMLTRFNQKYGKTILRNKYQVQSLDYRVIEGLHQINPKLDVLYIQPYNFTYPRSVADGYSMEYSTLNSDFIWQAHLQDHPVYAWTINDEKLMKKMMYDQVDGIITDRVSLAKKAIREFQQDSSYANRIMNYLIVAHMPSDLEA